MPFPYLRWYTCAFVAQGQEVKYLSPAGFPGHVSYIPRIVGFVSPHDISMLSPSWKNHLKISHETYIPNIPIPSGKRLQKTMENHHAIKNGKSTISMGP